MAKFNIEFFLANRISAPHNTDNKSVMVKIASSTVAIGIAIMIIAMAVIGGFKREITEKLIGFGAHFQIVNLNSNHSFESEPIIKNQNLVDNIFNIKSVESISGYAIKGGIIKGDDAMQGIILKGIEQGYDSTLWSSSMVEGRLPRLKTKNRLKEIIISKSVSDKLQINLDDRVEMMFVSGNRAPRRDQFKVCGVYDSGYEEIDQMVVLTDLRNVQRLNSWNDEMITGYEVNIDNFNNLDKSEQSIYNATIECSDPDSEPLRVLTIKERYRMMFDWLQTHNVNAAIIITIMVIVALLNMISALLIILFERMSMIGTLKALGMTNGAIQRMFLIRSSYIVIKGLIWGNILGVVLCLLQQHTHIVKLDPEAYLLSSVPIDISVGWVVMLNVATLAIIVSSLAIPAMIISFMKPEKSIRFQ